MTVSNRPDLPDLPDSQVPSDDDAAFDELARRAGAALRRPAPEDGVRAIVARKRNRQALKVSTVGGAAVVATLLGVLVVVSQRDDPDRLSPVESVPGTVPKPTAVAPVTTESVLESVPATIPTPTAATSSPSTAPTPAVVPSLWVELDPGATAALPPAPLPATLPPAFLTSDLLWTGTELIVWGGVVEDPQDFSPPQGLGAAFDPAAGTWREIAPPPDGVTVGEAVWTGTEMLAWSDGTADTRSAAYDPANDTWRMIADPPFPGEGALWIGDAAVLLGDPSGGGSGHAYDPATDEWRRLADGPWDPASAVWTGTTIIVNADMDSDGTSLAGYDPATDTWRVLEGVDEGWQPVVIPGRGGAAATVAMLPPDSGIPGVLLDDRGNAIGELPGRPAELAGRCETNPDDAVCMLTTQGAVLVGGEILYWNVGGSWAFDLEAQTWRASPQYDGVAAGDLLFQWASGDGLVYRAATPG